MKRIVKIIFVFVIGIVLCFSSKMLCAFIFHHDVETKCYFYNTTGAPYGEVGVSKIILEVNDGFYTKTADINVQKYNSQGEIYKYYGSIEGCYNDTGVVKSKLIVFHVNNTHVEIKSHKDIESGEWEKDSATRTIHLGDKQIQYKYYYVNGSWQSASDSPEEFQSEDDSELPWGLLIFYQNVPGAFFGGPYPITSSESDYIPGAYYDVEIGPYKVFSEGDCVDINIRLEINELINGIPSQEQSYIQVKEGTYQFVETFGLNG